ncbi:MAG: anti-sigma factor [Leptolyngbyaceae cyanobacterium RU_5_1]|nr:anti-sigma factor [Leptolyngbyaceae cyanobacterium RU_5_1]
MVRSMPAEHVQLLIAGYILGDLDPNEMAEFERLLADSPAIADEVARMQTALELSFAPPEVQPPAHLRSAILNASAPEPNSWTTARAQRNRSQRWSRAMSAVAAVLIVALAINNYRLWQTLQATQPEPVTTLTYSLQGTKAANTASATVVVNPKSLEGNLSIKNLPPLPSGKVYVLWTVIEKGAPFTVDAKNAILTKVLTVDAQGNVNQTITVPEVYRDSELVSKIAVTIEDAAAPQQHQGSPVMITSL